MTETPVKQDYADQTTTDNLVLRVSVSAPGTIGNTASPAMPDDHYQGLVCSHGNQRVPNPTICQFVRWKFVR
jgi:hypothetical protein